PTLDARLSRTGHAGLMDRIGLPGRATRLKDADLADWSGAVVRGGWGVSIVPAGAVRCSHD
ncbi:MAG TPA: hypothetical protein VHR66_29645, partial [Gemmataceae bacterium]|nr:hypothetical protein [Gemmataceae bacterium]